MTGRADRKYCAARCRVAAHRAREDEPLGDLALADAALQQALDFGRGETLWWLRRHLSHEGLEQIASALESSAAELRRDG